LTLTVNLSYLIEDEYSICDNGSYLWRDTLLSGLNAGTYNFYDSLLTTKGCDSVYRLMLTVNPTYLIEEEQTICENSNYVWRGYNLSGYSVGTYIIYDSLTTRYGCDSVYVLNLTVNSGYLFESFASICDNESYFWRDSLIIDLPYGVYTFNDSLVSINGCDSIYRLVLTVKRSYLFNEQRSICENGTYLWR